MRREWIEIQIGSICISIAKGLPPCGGSGLKFRMLSGLVHPDQSPSMRREWIEMVFPPRISIAAAMSPSMRREWIEMTLWRQLDLTKSSPSMRREWIEIVSLASFTIASASLPPCGGSGLKCYLFSAQNLINLVSLHAEGVD